MAKPPAELDRLMERLEGRISKAFAASIQDMRDAVNFTALIAHLRAGNTEAVMRALNLQPDMFAPLDAAITESFADGGRYEIGNQRVPDPDGVGTFVLRFDGRALRAETWAREHSSKLIVEILDDQRDMVRSVIRDEIERGVNPRQTALELVGRIDPVTGTRRGGFIGLTSQEAGYVSNAREQLAGGSPADLRAYLQRKARDKRFDHHVQRALETGDPIPNRAVNRMVERYKDRLLKIRGDRIARTEALTSLNAGRKEGFEQLVEKSGVPPERALKIWDATGDGRTRDSHIGMDGQSKPINEPFVSPNGYRLQFPGDAALGAPGSETIQCRCWVKYRIDYLAE